MSNLEQNKVMEIAGKNNDITLDKVVDKDITKKIESIKANKELSSKQGSEIVSAKINNLKKGIEIVKETKVELGKNNTIKKKKGEKDILTKVSIKEKDSKIENTTDKEIEGFFGKNAFSTLLKQLSALFALLMGKITGNNTNYGDTVIIEKGGDKVNFKEEEKIELTKNEELDKIYNQYSNYKKYRKYIQLCSVRDGISELEIIKLLIKENNSADSTAKGPGENTSIYGIGQMSNATWKLIENEECNGNKMDRFDARTQISMAVKYMKYIKRIRKCSDSETKFFYNAGHNFELNDDLIDKKYISGNLKSIIYKNPKYNGKSINYISKHMTKKEYYNACIAYYDGVKYIDEFQYA